jgi:hypothetical protein
LATQFAKYGGLKKPFAGFLPGHPSDLTHCYSVRHWKGGLKARSLNGAIA